MCTPANLYRDAGPDGSSRRLVLECSGHRRRLSAVAARRGAARLWRPRTHAGGTPAGARHRLRRRGHAAARRGRLGCHRRRFLCGRCFEPRSNAPGRNPCSAARNSLSPRWTLCRLQTRRSISSSLTASESRPLGRRVSRWRARGRARGALRRRAFRVHLLAEHPSDGGIARRRGAVRLHGVFGTAAVLPDSGATGGGARCPWFRHGPGRAPP